MSYATKSTAEQAKDDVMTDLRKGATETANAVKREAGNVSDSVTRGVHAVKSAVSETAANVADDMRDLADNVTEDAKSTARSVQQYVMDKTETARARIETEAQANPLRTVGLAALAGLVVGALLAR